jgi:putative hydrolase of the HAD superfamily
MQHIKVIAFDADDTLWVNEPYFRDTEEKFAGLLENFLPHHSVEKALLKNEIKNLPLYGYGIKGFMLSMIETALEVSEKKISLDTIETIIALGQEMINRPIELLDGVETVLQALQGKYKLVVATKGDLLDQERKLMKSGLEHYFHHIEIMSEKRPSDYQKLINHLDIQPDAFMMIGNSVKSDVLPVLELGGYGVHVPYHTTWALETAEVNIENPRYHQVNSIADILPLLQA